MRRLIAAMLLLTVGVVSAAPPLATAAMSASRANSLALARSPLASAACSLPCSKRSRPASPPLLPMEVAARIFLTRQPQNLWKN